MRRQDKELLDYHLREADRLALAEVERLARSIMRRHPRLHEFCMGMGSWCFWTKDGQQFDDSDLKYLSPIGNFLYEYEDLKLTGTPMRFTVDGPVVTNW